MPTPMLRASYLQLCRTDWKSIYLAQGKLHNEQGARWLNYVPADRNPWTDQNVQGFGQAQDLSDGVKFTRDSYTVLNNLTHDLTQYGLAGEAGYSLFKWDRSGLIKGIPKQLERSQYYARQYRQHAILDRAFNTAFTGFYTGEALCGAHTVNGATVNNFLTTAGTYDVEFVMSAEEHFSSLTDPRGLPIVARPKYHVIPDNRIKILAREIFGSAKQPFGPDNTINALVEEDYEILVSRFLSSTTACFVLGEKGGVEDGGHDLQFVYGDQNLISMWEDPDARVVVMAVFSEDLSTWGEWRQTYGTQGTAA